MKDKKIGTLDDLIAAAVPLVAADEAEALLSQPAIDVTGIELTPGDPDRCAGNGKADPMACCCDGCDYLAACHPQEPSKAP